MSETTNRNCTPEEYIRELFADTKDGIMPVTHHPFFEEPYTMRHRIEWTKEDAEALVERYTALTDILTSIGRKHNAVMDDVDPAVLSTDEERQVWETYLAPFTPFETDISVIAELQFRRETDSLDEDENELLERHHDWFVENSRRRLPYDRCCPAKFINRAQRYERLVSLNAPESVLAEEGRWLAVEMAVYYYGIEK